MKKFSILIVVGCILCIGLAGATGYYIGSKTQKPVQSSNNTDSKTKVATDTDANTLKAQLKEEVRAELYDEVYEEAYDAAYKAIEADLDAKIDELQKEAAKASEEKSNTTKTTEVTESPKHENTQPTNSNNVGGDGGEHKPSTTERPAVQAYINVHDVTASMSGGTAAIEAALNGAVDSSSGTVTCDTSSITGIGTFPVYWTSTDGATAISYITVTE